jgi:hypothetical protein
MQEKVCFSKLDCFFPWLVGWFCNFEQTQNREKTRNGLMNIVYQEINPEINLLVFTCNRQLDLSLTVVVQFITNF